MIWSEKSSGDIFGDEGNRNLNGFKKIYFSHNIYTLVVICIKTIKTTFDIDFDF